MPGPADPAPRGGAGADPLQPASAPQNGAVSAPVKPPVGKLPPPRGGGGSSRSSRSTRRSPKFVRSATVSKAFLFSIWFNQLAQGLTALAPKTLGVYQVRSFFQGEREGQIGPATGALSAAFAASQLATQFLWGWASDYTGRPKMLILLANVGCGIGASWFAFATTYGEAIAARIIAGSFMASGVVLKAVLGLTLEKNAQAIAMAYRTLGAGCGQVVTPIIIGQLADPCTRWNMPHGCADGSFLRTHPFALSGAVIAAISTAAALLNFFIFPEIRTVDGGPVGTGARRKHAAAAKLSCPRRTTSLQSEPSATSESASRVLPAVPQSAFATAAAAATPRSTPAPLNAGAAAPPRRTPPSSVSFAPRPTVLTPPAGATPAASASTTPAASTAAATAATTPTQSGVLALAETTLSPPPAAGLRSRRASSSLRSSMTRAASRTQSTLASMRSAAATRLQPARTALTSAATAWGFEGMAGADYGGEADLDAARAAAASVRRRMSSLRPPSAPSAPSPPRPALPGDEESLEPPPPPPWWKHRPALLAVCAYAAVTFLFDAYLDLVNLYGSAPRTRVNIDRTVPGLELPVNKLSWIITLGGVCVVLFSLLAYPPLQRRIGVSRCATFGLLAGIPTALIPPFAYLAWPAGQGATLGVLAVGQVAYGVSFATTSTSSQILTNLCAPDGAIGSVNGAGNTLAALIRVIGPMVTGGLWAIAAKAMQSNDQFMPFGVLSGLFAVTAFTYWMTGLSDADMSADR